MQGADFVHPTLSSDSGPTSLPEPLIQKGRTFMHEMSLVHNVLDIVLGECEEKGVAAVKSVYLTIGEGRDIVVPLFEGLFQHLARGTVAADAQVVIRRVPLTVRCACGHVFPIDMHDERTWTCDACGQKQRYRIHSGMEFMVSGLEVAAKADVAARVEATENEAEAEERMAG